MKLTKTIIFKCLVVKFLHQKNPYFNSHKNIHLSRTGKKKILTYSTYARQKHDYDPRKKLYSNSIDRGRGS